MSNPSTNGQRPFDARFARSDRYTAGKEHDPTTVIVEGAVCAGEVVGRNGPRVQVRFELGGSHYVRWFDRDDLLDEQSA